MLIVLSVRLLFRETYALCHFVESRLTPKGYSVWKRRDGLSQCPTWPIRLTDQLSGSTGRLLSLKTRRNTGVYGMCGRNSWSLSRRSSLSTSSYWYNHGEVWGSGVKDDAREWRRWSVCFYNYQLLQIERTRRFLTPIPYVYKIRSLVIEDTVFLFRYIDHTLS